ncbi:transporter substrate-binding domain-containing diguanylate cyclase [Poseidonibacter ostreae]|jgi:diguanylate cyclase (GGDEF)-like protein|uniref:diguanylate cyclase n=1 Tax=Poseidonibacter ostreae TaxID=2654171 RepID=A0ABQ6VNB4_9BACT|nr:diguanylate cyclase [Poseidonibacter ostreae]KAB7886892.1 diguanylate cyclase [Poseidonibacter ostreae]KAB7892184.1 diguanylate cyclase [Poseidonibacter ostreae]
MNKVKFLLFFLIFTNCLFANEIIDYVKLTPKEEAFLRNTKIKVITSNTWAPINMYNDKDELSGIAIDFWNKIKERAHINSEIVTAKDWNHVLNSIKNKEADITIGTSYDKNKLDYANFTSSYISFPIAFATLFDKRFIPNASFLEGKKVAVGENYSSHNILKEHFPNIDFVTVKNTKEALELLSAGKVEAAVDILPTIAHLISVNGYYNLKISGTSEHKVHVSFMIRKDYKQLQTIINKHIAMLSPEDKNSIIRQWLIVKFDKTFVGYEYLVQILILILLAILFYSFKQKDLREYNKKLKKLSTTDSLINLHNRRKLDELLNDSKNKKYSLILLDIDHFKEINDIHGHLEGDKVLVELSRLLKNSLNKNDEIGRWGGEEFLIICKNTTEKDASVIALRLKKLIEEYDFKIRKVTASFGVSEAKKELTLKDILANADNALYKAKQQGRNQVVLASSL